MKQPRDNGSVIKPGRLHLGATDLQLCARTTVTHLSGDNATRLTHCPSQGWVSLSSDSCQPTNEGT